MSSIVVYGGGGGNRGEIKTGIVFFIPQKCQAKITIGAGGSGGVIYNSDPETGGFAKSGEASMFTIENVISIIAEGGHKGFDASDLYFDTIDISLTGGMGKHCYVGYKRFDIPAVKGVNGFQPGGSAGTVGGGGAGGYSSGPKAEDGENPDSNAVDPYDRGTGGAGGTGYGAGGGGGGYIQYTIGSGCIAGKGGDGNSGCVALWKLF